MNLRLKLQIFFFLVFLLPGLLSTVYSARLLAGALDLASDGVAASGVITKYARQENMRRVGRRFCPVVEFRSDGGVHQFVDEWCNKSQKQYPPGSTVEVIYKENHPATARINEFMVLYGKGLFIGIIGLPFLLLGIVMLFRAKV